MRSGVGTRASRRLVAAVVLILLPAVVLGYFGVRAVAAREIGIRLTYTATTVLVRDRLTGELTRVESALAVDLARPGVGLGDPIAAGEWLRRISAARPWLANPFLLDRDGGVLTIDLRDGWSRASVELANPFEALPRVAASIRAAEAAEFVDGRLDRALERYRQALGAASSDAARALVRMRIGRTLFKLRRFEEAIAQYRTVVALRAGALIPDGPGIPYTVNAFLQIADGLEALGRAGERATLRREVLQFVVDHPWDMEDGYEYYLARAVEAATTDAASLRTRAGALARAAGTIRWIQRDIRPRVERDMNGGAWTGITTRRFVVPRDAQPVPIACVALSVAGDHSVPTVLGYEIRADYVAAAMLANVLKTVDLGQELRVEVLNGQSRQASPLAHADLEAVLPGWRVGLFDRNGRSIDQLVARERWTYGTLIVGLIVVLIGGVAFTMRASAREAELSRLKTEFVSNVSHELKTPLALIRMFSETLESGTVSDEATRQEFYAIIRRESDRLTHLINNVLDVARIDAGTKQYALTEHDVVALVREAIEAYQPLFDRLGFAVETTLPESTVVVFMDPDALARALVNLFQNAVKYSGDVKRVAVSVGVRDGMARLSVADHGVGIAPEHVPRIFEAHYRIHGDGAAGSAGSGLGLAIVKHAMEAHGGRVEVESTPERGSVFTLIVPIRNAGA